MLAAILHPLLGVVTAAEEGKKVVLVMLATGGVFILVIVLGELTHLVGKQRRRRDS